MISLWIIQGKIRMIHWADLLCCSTTENVARYIWQLLVGPIESSGARLYSIKVHETDKNSAEFRG